MGESSSRKLRRAIYYTLYRMDLQKTHYNIYFCATMSKTRQFRGKNTQSPLTPFKEPYLPLGRAPKLPINRPSGCYVIHSVLLKPIHP